MHSTPLSRGSTPKYFKMDKENELNSFKLWLIRLGYAESTIKGYVRLLDNFFKYLNQRKPNQKEIENFIKDLHQTKASRQYIQGHINVINRYSAFLEKTKKQKLAVSKIIVEKEIRTQRTIFSQSEIKALFSSTKENTPQGLMDKAMLSIYYGCGLRSKEGINLEPKELDFNKGLIYVKPSKNYQSRYVPMSQKVIQDLKEYQEFAREIINTESNYLLVGKSNPQVTGQYLNSRLKKLMKKANITKKATLHSLRHSIATHLLQQGMELEYIGNFLGHKRLDSTQIYVRISEELNNEEV